MKTKLNTEFREKISGNEAIRLALFLLGSMQKRKLEISLMSQDIGNVDAEERRQAQTS